jgi:branched-chain amino acid transport system permease protein
MRAALAHRLWTPALLAAIVVAGGLLLTSNFHLRVAALIFIFGLAAIGLNILVGFAGQVSLGHAGFLGIGAYATAIGPTHLGLPPLVAAGAGIVLAGGLAFLVGRPILRLRGHYLAVATLGLGILIAMLITNESTWTGGPDGMPVSRLEVFGWRVRGADTWYWIAGTMLVVGALLAVNLLVSPSGRALRALHDSEIAAAVVGIDVSVAKLTAFVIAAVYAAIAGAMFALFNGFVTPDAAGFINSIELITMVVLGGMGSVFGAVVGAAILVVLPQALTVFHDYEHMMLGLIMMAVMIFLRAGIVPSLIALVSAGGRR